jgi:hypothetical protein
MSARNRALMVMVSVIFSCFVTGSASPQTVPFETIDIGEISYFQYNDPSFSGSDMVIKDLKTWAWVWRRHTKGIQPVPPVPLVDFKTEMVLAVMLGYQTSGGGPGIKITAIDQLFPTIPWRTIRVVAQESREPGLLDVITNPYHIVRVKKTTSVVFVRETFDDTCADNSECPENAFCLFRDGACMGPGKCFLRPEACIQLYAPVCGCDSKTYSNECAAHQNGVSILHAGACKISIR